MQRFPIVRATKQSCKRLTAKMLQSVLREKNSKEVSPPLSKGLIFSFLLEYLMALKMQDVCPEVVVEVVADADDMLNGEDHVESRC